MASRSRADENKAAILSPSFSTLSQISVIANAVKVARITLHLFGLNPCAALMPIIRQSIQYLGDELNTTGDMLNPKITTVMAYISRLTLVIVLISSPHVWLRLTRRCLRLR